MRLTVVLDADVPDDEDGRKLLAWYLRLLSTGHDKYISIDVKEGIVHDQNGVAVGSWKIEPSHCEDAHCELPKGHTGAHKMGIYVRVP